MPQRRKCSRVLIVDDELMIANTLVQILKASGLEAQAVYEGEKAGPAAAEFRPDVLLTDVILRGMSGIDVAIEVSQMLPECRIILFSGQASIADILEPVKSKGHNFEVLTKPVHPQVLLQMLGASE